MGLSGMDLLTTNMEYGKSKSQAVSAPGLPKHVKFADQTVVVLETCLDLYEDAEEGGASSSR